MKIGIIGAGRVGATTAFCIAESGIVDEIILVDAVKELAIGEAEDINQGLVLFPKETIVKGGDYKDLSDCNLIIITAGLRRKEGETRLSLINKNLSLVADIVKNITSNNRNCLLFVVSNPVDIMTYAVLKISGFAKERVFGLGTYLDTLRLKSIIKRAGKDPKDAIMIGEHGEKMVAISCCDKEIIDKVRGAGAWMIKHKGGAGWTVGMACLEIVKAIALDKKEIFPLSSFIPDYGISISIPTIIGREGIIGHPKISLTEEEKEKFIDSTRVIKEQIASLNL
ncbi:MAG: L-lactate dehydrogenase [bacterium]